MGILRRLWRLVVGRFTVNSLIAKHIGKNGGRILDLGCGRNSPLKTLPQRKRVYAVGFDHYEPYIELSRQLSIHDEYIKGDLRHLSKIKSKSFEYVISTEVLEHLMKDDGRKLIQNMERIATKKILLTTPNGFLKTFPGPEDNPDEAHVCGWKFEEFVAMGFKVYGLNGFKFLWSVENGQAVPRFCPRFVFEKIIAGQAVPRFCPRFVFEKIIAISEMLAHYNPRGAFQFFLVKEVSDKK